MQQQYFSIDRNKSHLTFLDIVRGQSWAHLTSMKTQEETHFPDSCLHKDLTPRLRLEEHSERKEDIMLAQTKSAEFMWTKEFQTIKLL